MTRLPLLFALACALGAVSGALRRVCYHTNWSQYRNGPAKFYPENIDPSLCTHIIYAFAKMNGNKLAAFEWNDESTPWMKGMYERFQAIKQTNPSVKMSLAVGGWNMGSAPFTRMVASDAGRKEFARTSIQFLRKNGFEGLDMDWEYPANRGSPAVDKSRFILLLQELRSQFNAEAVPAGKERLLLSAAVGAGKEKIDTAYDIPQMSSLLDMINLMTYDLHGSWEDFTGHHSALYSRASETGNQTFLNVNWAAQYYVSHGADRAKMNIGMPLYGRSFKLPYGHSSETIGCSAGGAGAAGLYTREAGFIAYYEVCPHLASGATKYYDSEGKVPYFVDGDLWVGYEDPNSLKTKVDYVKQEGFGGVMVWALDLDDFSGACGQGKYPLMRAIIDELNANSPVNPVTNAPVTLPPATRPPVTRPPFTYPPVTNAPVTNPPYTYPPVTNAPVTNPPGSSGNHHDLNLVSATEFDCRTRPDGYYPNPHSCSVYYVCAAMMTFRTDCHPGLMFNAQSLYCDFPDHVNCQASAAQTAPLVVQTQPPRPVYTNPPVTARPTNRPYNPPTNAPTTQKPWVPSATVDTTDFCNGKTDGFYHDPTDCSHFYQCSFGASYREPCPSGTYFSDALQGCDWPTNVPNCP